MKLGFIYAGQGTQYVGMGQSFYESDEDCKNLLDNVKLDFDLKDIMFNSDEKTISTTRFTQPEKEVSQWKRPLKVLRVL